MSESNRNPTTTPSDANATNELSTPSIPPAPTNPNPSLNPAPSTSSSRPSHHHNRVLPPQVVVNPKKRVLELSNAASGMVGDDDKHMKDTMDSDLNVRLDNDIDSMINCFRDIIVCSKVGDKDKFRIQQEKYQVECRTANLIKSCESILGLISELKYSYLLADTTAFHPDPIEFPEPGTVQITPESGDIEPESKRIKTQRQMVMNHLRTLPNIKPRAYGKVKSLKDLFPQFKPS